MDAFWALCLQHFEQSLPHQQFRTWIQPLQARVSGRNLVVQAPNRFVLQWVKDRFLPVIEQLAQDHQKGQFTISLELAQRSTPAPTPAAAAPASASSDRGKTAGARDQSPEPDRSRSTPSSPARPISWRGPPHCRSPSTPVPPTTRCSSMAAWAWARRTCCRRSATWCRTAIRNAKIRYIHAEQYVSDVVRAYQHKAFDGFKKYYHSLDLLLIDDIQFFSGKTRTQEEFFYAFNALIEAHKQVIITCDTYPKEISGMEDRLISRFGWGLTVAIEPPELEMRVAILIKKAEVDGIGLVEDVAFFIAKHIQSNVRELEGGLKRVIAYSNFAGQPISVELAREALKDLLAIQYPADIRSTTSSARSPTITRSKSPRCTRRSALAMSPVRGRWRWRWRRS